MKKVGTLALFISFIVTILEPITGILIHKLAATVFLLLVFAHMAAYRKRPETKKYLLLLLVAASFATGVCGMIVEQYPLILLLHRAISAVAVIFLVLHIYRYRKRFSR